MLDIFACCLHRKLPKKRAQPDERTFLIPADPQPEIVDDEATRKQRELQDRLTDIVQAKEGKMVNLLARLPFNLHNKNLSSRLDPSSSRSASESVLAPSSPRYPITYSQLNFSRIGAVGGSSRNPSESRCSSLAVGNYDDEDIIPIRPPILNLRLVNPNPIISSNDVPRGRSPTIHSIASPDTQTQVEQQNGTTSQLSQVEGHEIDSPTTTISLVDKLAMPIPSLRISQPNGTGPFTNKPPFKIQQKSPLILESWDS